MDPVLSCGGVGIWLVVGSLFSVYLRPGQLQTVLINYSENLLLLTAVGECRIKGLVVRPVMVQARESIVQH